MKKNRRIHREKITLEIMVKLYCMLNHKSKRGLCNECGELLDYAFKKLEKCPYSNEKPQCLKCPVHCYQTEQREKVRQIMRFSGPKMIYRHPYLAVMHLIDRKIEPKSLKK